MRTVYVGGEYSFNPWYHGPACLGITAQNLYMGPPGFDVRGISGAIFPAHPELIRDDPRGVEAMLYDNAVSLDSVITAHDS